MEARKKLLSSLAWALGNFALTTIAFLALCTVRFSALGIWLTRFVAIGFLGTTILAVKDIFKRNTRWQAVAAALFCLPVLFFFGLLTVWEGPLYVAVKDSVPLNFRVDGAAGFYGIEIYGPEHSEAEWRSDDIGLIGGFHWQQRREFPPMIRRFGYGSLPNGYSQETPAVGTVRPLDPNVTYTVVVQPGMGMREYFMLRDGVLIKAEDEYAVHVCWGPLRVVGVRDPAYVRINCETKEPLPMSERGQARLKAYQAKQITYY